MSSRILDRVFNVMAVLSGLLLLFMTFSISYSIFARLVGIAEPIWTVQFNEYALLWMTFLGSAWVLSRRKHVSMDVVTSRLKPPALGIMDRIHGLMGIGVCGVLFWYGAAVTWDQFQRGVTEVQAVDVPKFLILMVIPFGFLTLGVQFARNLFVRSAGTVAHKGTAPEAQAELPQEKKD